MSGQWSYTKCNHSHLKPASSVEPIPMISQIYEQDQMSKKLFYRAASTPVPTNNRTDFGVVSMR